MKVVYFLLKLFPFWLILGYYICADPFGLRSFMTPKKYHMMEASGDYETIERFICQRANHKYDSFIFGNSKALAFHGDSWIKKIKTTCDVYSMSSPGENIQHILNKCKYITSENVKLKNALIILDLQSLYFDREANKHDGPVFLHHPYSTGNSWFNFHGKLFWYFLQDLNFIKCIQYSITSNYSNSMKGILLNPISTKSINFNVKANQHTLIELENQIKNDSINFYKKRAKTFNFKDEELKFKSQLKLNSNEKAVLQELKKIFDESKTNYKIVLGPCIDKVKLNSKDLVYLEKLFDKERIFDYTGESKFTKSIGFYYEVSHYRPFVGEIILNEVYK